LRQLAVQQVTLDHSGWWYAYAFARILSAMVCVALPVGALLLLTEADRPEERVARVVVQALVSGEIAMAYGIQQRRTAGWRLAWLSLVAAAVTAILVALRLVALITLRTRLIWPLALRWGGWLLPSQHIAVRLLLLVVAFPGSGTHEQIFALSPELREMDGSTDRVDRVGDARHRPAPPPRCGRGRGYPVTGPLSPHAPLTRIRG
jgi:hypothetical protein